MLRSRSDTENPRWLIPTCCGRRRSSTMHKAVPLRGSVPAPIVSPNICANLEESLSEHRFQHLVRDVPRDDPVEGYRFPDASSLPYSDFFGWDPSFDRRLGDAFSHENGVRRGHSRDSRGKVHSVAYIVADAVQDGPGVNSDPEGR